MFHIFISPFSYIILVYIFVWGHLKVEKTTHRRKGHEGSRTGWEIKTKQKEGFNWASGHELQSIPTEKLSTICTPLLPEVDLLYPSGIGQDLWGHAEVPVWPLLWGQFSGEGGYCESILIAERKWVLWIGWSKGSGGSTNNISSFLF